MKKIWALVKAWWSNSLIERGDMFLYSLSILSAPLIIMTIWLVVSKSGANIPLSYNQIIIYYFANIVIRTVQSSWFGQFLPYRIRSGKISPFLLKPMPYIYDIIGNNIAEKIMKLVFIVPVVAVLALILRVNWPTFTMWEFVLALLSILSGAFIFFLLDMCMGMAAFWMDETKALQEVYGLLYSFFSGAMIPLVVFPVILQKIGFVLPFRYMLSLPIEIILRQLNSSELVTALLIQTAYLIASMGLYKVLWKQGLKIYSASGA